MNTAPLHHSQSPVAVSPIPIEIRWLVLRWRSEGKINHWLGPALRGMTLYPLRRSLCLLGDDGFADTVVAGDSRTDPRRCRNCQRMPSCSYGQVMEPDLEILNRPFYQGSRDGMRGVTFGAALQRETNTAVGEQAFVRLLATGPWAVDLLPQVIQTLSALGQRRGLGPDHVRFDLQVVDQAQESYALQAKNLTGIEDSTAVIPRLKITMDSPLVARKTWNHQPPRFQDIAMAAIQTVSRAARQYGDDRIDHVDFGELKQRSSQVKSTVSDWQSDQYSRSSSRHEGRWNLKSWIGTAVYKDVPVAFLPWLQWGGILGVGDSRNCGAGLWSLQL